MNQTRKSIYIIKHYYIHKNDNKRFACQRQNVNVPKRQKSSDENLFGAFFSCRSSNRLIRLSILGTQFSKAVPIKTEFFRRTNWYALDDGLLIRFARNKGGSWKKLCLCEKGDFLWGKRFVVLCGCLFYVIALCLGEWSWNCNGWFVSVRISYTTIWIQLFFVWKW